MRANAKCPNCQTPMMIAGWIDRQNIERAEGKQIISRFQCQGCQKIIVPTKA